MSCIECGCYHFEYNGIKMVLEEDYPQHYRDFIISLIDIYGFDKLGRHDDPVSNSDVSRSDILDPIYGNDCGVYIIGREYKHNKYIVIEFTNITPGRYGIVIDNSTFAFSNIDNIYDMLNNTFPDWRKDAVSKRVINE